MKTFLPRLLILVGLFLSVTFGSPEPIKNSSSPVVIGSANFVESRLLAEIFAQALEAEGVAVERHFDLGPREVYLEALRQGDIDLIPEYLGSALRYLSDDPAAGNGDPSASVTYSALQATLQDTELRALDYADAENTNVVVVTQALADRYDLLTISDLRGAASELVFGGSAECMERIACYRGLTDIYDLSFRDVKTLDTAGPDTVMALADGEVDVTFLFSTQGVITEQGFVMLEDDRGAQPAENIVPIVRAETVENLGESLTDPLNAITDRLTTGELRALNTRMDGGVALADVAREWLRENLGN